MSRFEGSELPNGCYPQLTMPAWGFKAFVPKAKFVKPSPYITRFSPGHDARFISQGNDGETIQIGFEFSQEMNCSQITDSLTVTSKALNDESAQIDTTSVSCSSFAETQVATWPGALTSVFGYQVNLTNVYPGIHRITVSNVTTAEGNLSTNVSIFSPMQLHSAGMLSTSGSPWIISCFASERRTTPWSGRSWPTTAGLYFLTPHRRQRNPCRSGHRLQVQICGATRSTSGLISVPG